VVADINFDIVIEQLVFQVMISLLGAVLYVIEMYLQVVSWPLFALETILSLFFAIDYILFFYIAKDKCVAALHIEVAATWFTDARYICVSV
jgi:hypothetical protein